MSIKRNRLKKQVEDNLEVKKRTGYDTQILKEGSHSDHSRRHLEENTIGASLGITKNMGDFESLRVDVWATVNIGNQDMDSAYQELIGFLDTKVNEAVKYYSD